MKPMIAMLMAGGVLLGASLEVEALIASYAKEVKAANPAFIGFDASRGKAIFTQEQTQTGKPMSCTTCHQSDLTQSGKNPKTGRSIRPLSPTANPNRLTDAKEVQKWLKRNFNDVYGRDGTPLEKGDVLHYIQTQ